MPVSECARAMSGILKVLRSPFPNSALLTWVAPTQEGSLYRHIYPSLSGGRLAFQNVQVPPRTRCHPPVLQNDHGRHQYTRSGRRWGAVGSCYRMGHSLESRCRCALENSMGPGRTWWLEKEMMETETGLGSAKRN
jgi:hypothetical protein